MVELMNFLRLSCNEHGIAYSLAKQALESFLLGAEAFLQYKERIRAISNKAFLAQFQILFQELNGCMDLTSEAEHIENEGGGRHRFNLLYDYAVIFLGEPVAEITLYKVYLKACQDIFSFLASVAAQSKEVQPSCYLPYGDVVNVSENASVKITAPHQLIKTEDAIKKIASLIVLYDDNALEAYLKTLQNCFERDHRLAIHLMPHLNLNASSYPLILIYDADQACWFIENCGDYTLSASFTEDQFADMVHKIKQDMGFQHNHEFLLESSFYYFYNQESALKLSAAMPFFMAEVGDWESVQALLEEGLDVNAQAADGDTLLHRAVKGGNFCMVQLLLDKGANPNIETKNGETAFAQAVSISVSDQNKIDYGDIIEALIDKGVDFSKQKNSLITKKEVLSDFGVQQYVAEIEKYSQCLSKKWIRRDLAKKKSLALMNIVQACRANGTFFSKVQLVHVRNIIQQEEAVLSQHRHWPKGILYFFKQPILKNRVSSYKKVMALDQAIERLLAA